MKQKIEHMKRMARKIGLRRAQIASTRLYVERHGLASFASNPRRSGGRILCYHSVGTPEMGVNDVTPVQFRRHIEVALTAGFSFVPAAQIARGDGGRKDLAITFDDAIKSVHTQAAPILADYGIPWSVFVIAGWAERTDPFGTRFSLGWSELGELAARGALLGSHSMTHPDFAKLNPLEMKSELEDSRMLFEKRLGFLPDEFAIPFGQSANWTKVAHEAAKRAGYETIYAQAEETRPPGTVPRTFVTKFDRDRTFKALLRGAYDRWEEWY
jgi:peptidoglycan/xylan/chitin deacetylase (PgdA/CDA1 family)